MKIGLQISNFTWPNGPQGIAGNLARIGHAADQAGFGSLWVMDHFFQIGDRNRSRGLGPAEDEMLEGYSTLAYLAGHTQKIKLGTLVTGVIYRHPGILIKTVSTLDVLSGGRTYLGLGVAWNEREAIGLGIPFPPLGERFRRLEETLQIAQQMWSTDNGPYIGKYYQLAETLNNPQPLSKPHPPILIGGNGEQKTLLLVARYADACNLLARVGIDVLHDKLEVLKRHCETVGRDYAEIEKTVLDTVHLGAGLQSPTDVIAHCRQLAGLGIQHVILNMPNDYEITPLETFGREIIPAVAEI